MHTPATAAQLTPTIFAAFKAFINQRPGLEPRNYYDPADLTNGRRQTYRDGRRAYASEARRIQKDGTAARKALTLAQEYPFDAVAMLDSFRAFSGRLQPMRRWKMPYIEGSETNTYQMALAYTTGQYFPTEYRAAALAVLTAYIQAVRPKHAPTLGQRFETVSDLARANEAAGFHWFSKDNKRFFRSRIEPTLYHGRELIYFVSTEKRGFDDNGRDATARVFDPRTADVNTVSEFGARMSIAGARSIARDLAKREKAGEHVKPLAQGDKCEFCGHYREYCTGTARPVDDTASDGSPRVLDAATKGRKEFAEVA
jgi:hypothetical protein